MILWGALCRWNTLPHHGLQFALFNFATDAAGYADFDYSALPVPQESTEREMQICRSENQEWVGGAPAADPRITALKGFPLQRRQLAKTGGVPQPAEDRSGVLEAFQLGPIAMQAVRALTKTIL